MYEISREFWFSAAHRIEGHPKCGRLHGHNYRVVVVLKGEPNADCMVMDYSKLDDIVKPIVEALDHRYLVSGQNIDRKDIYWQAALNTGRSGDMLRLDVEQSTAEELACWLYDRIRVAVYDVLEDASVWLERIVVWETPKSSATFGRPI